MESNIVFSMPRGTPPEKLLAAVPKTVSEQGVRLNIRKATLREWRRDFAEALRKQGVAANATERAVRGLERDGEHAG